MSTTAPGRTAAAGDDAGAVAAEIRRFLAGATGHQEWLRVPADAPLLHGDVALDSLSGTLLLREIQRRFGVDVAAEDLNLDALATLAALASFIAARTAGAPGDGPDAGNASAGGRCR